MPRMPRVVVPDIPHHVIQRGNRRQNVFFKESDKASYLKILRLHAKLFEFEVWAYCLMDNHIHLIIVPKTEESLIKGIGQTHQLYTQMINFREKWRGYLWQGRFKSSPMDEQYLYVTMRYVECNPLRAGLVKRAQDYKYSSAKAHIYKTKDRILSDFFMTQEIKNWTKYLSEKLQEEDIQNIRTSTQTGRPLGSKKFIKLLEKKIGRVLLKQKPGPKNKGCIVCP